MIDKEKLLGKRAETESGMPEDELDIEGLGTIRVRGLSRIEAVVVAAQKGVEATERKMVTFGMVDPVLTESEVGQWMKIGLSGEMQEVTNRISELSGMSERADKTAYKSSGE